MPGTIIVVALLVAVIGVAVFSTVKRIRYGSSCCGSKDPMPSKVKVKDKNKSHYPYAYLLKVDGMHCSGCVRRLEKKEVLLRSKKELQRQDAGRVVSSAGYTMLSFEESELNG